MTGSLGPSGLKWNGIAGEQLDFERTSHCQPCFVVLSKPHSLSPAQTMCVDVPLRTTRLTADKVGIYYSMLTTTATYWAHSRGCFAAQGGKPSCCCSCVWVLSADGAEDLLCLQSEVDNASDFAVVLDHFEEWMAARELGLRYSVAIVTDGSVLKETQGGGVEG